MSGQCGQGSAFRRCLFDCSHSLQDRPTNLPVRQHAENARRPRWTRSTVQFFRSLKVYHTAAQHKFAHQTQYRPILVARVETKILYFAAFIEHVTECAVLLLVLQQLCWLSFHRNLSVLLPGCLRIRHYTEKQLLQLDKTQNPWNTMALKPGTRPSFASYLKSQVPHSISQISGTVLV